MPRRKATKEEIKYAYEVRNEIKPSNFSLLYGGGIKCLAASLRKAFPALGKEKSKELAKKLMAIKKGKKNRNTGLFEGGSDSAAYNAMLKVAYSEDSALPVLGSKIPEPLRVEHVRDSFITSRCNFAIQSLGSEFLSCLITMITYLKNKNNVEAYFCLAIHKIRCGFI